MNKIFTLIYCFLVLTAVCWAGGNKETEAKPTPQAQQQSFPDQSQIQQKQTQQQQVQQIQPLPPPASKYFTGDGGKGMSLTITPPKPNGFAESQKYLPLLAHNEFIANFKNYSAIDVLDYERLGNQYDILLSGYFDDNAKELDLGHKEPTTHQMGGSITRTATGYALQIQITRNTDKMTIASYSGTFTFAELDNLTGIRRASLELLQKMGITLTALAQGELTKAETENRVNAQIALAQGITAQQRGTVVEALSYFIQSTNYDPNLVEAASRMNILSANISSGNIGQDTRNDIAWRRQWVERLQETENFFTNYVKEQPYYLVYDTNIKKGRTNYQNETVELSFDMGLTPEPSWVTTINDVIWTVKAGLLATGREKTWELDWPYKSISQRSFASKNNNYIVIAEILNDRGQIIGRQTIYIPYGYNYRFKDLDKHCGYTFGSLEPIQWHGVISFPSVNANSITDLLTIRITNIDGLSAETASRQKKINIMPTEEFRQHIGSDESSLFKIDESGCITYYDGSQAQLVIPTVINGIYVTEVKGIYKSFGLSVFHNVTFPSNVKIIHGNVFGSRDYDKLPVSITLGAGVHIFGYIPMFPSNIFLNNFAEIYVKNGRKAGTYTRSGKIWTYSQL